jgi:hypothetical protein
MAENLGDLIDICIKKKRVCTLLNLVLIFLLLYKFKKFKFMNQDKEKKV